MSGGRWGSWSWWSTFFKRGVMQCNRGIVIFGGKGVQLVGLVNFPKWGVVWQQMRGGAESLQFWILIKISIHSQTYCRPLKKTLYVAKHFELSEKTPLDIWPIRWVPFVWEKVRKKLNDNGSFSSCHCFQQRSIPRAGNSLKSNERLLAIHSDRSRKLSDCERISQVAHDKWATVSEKNVG